MASFQRLPLEVLICVIKFTDDAPTVRSLSMVSRFWYRQAMSYSWMTVGHVHRLLETVSTTHRPRLHDTPELRGFSDRRMSRDARENELLSFLEIGLAPRLGLVGRYVRTLTIGLAVLPYQTHVELDALRELWGGALLPNLHSLHVQHPDDGIYDNCPNPRVLVNDASHYFSLFLCPSVRVASFMSVGKVVDAAFIHSRAPLIEDFRFDIGSDPVNDEEPQPGRPGSSEWAPDFALFALGFSGALQTWPLTSLTFNGHFLRNGEIVAAIGRLPQLRRLRILRALHPEHYAPPPGLSQPLFVSLRVLDLEFIPVDTALAILRFGGIGKRIEEFGWRNRRSPKIIPLPALFHELGVSGALRRIRLHDQWGISQGQNLYSLSGAAALLEQARLSDVTVHFKDRTHILAGPPALLCRLGPQLEVLRLPGLIVPWQLLYMLSGLYPLLRELQVTLDISMYEHETLRSIFPAYLPPPKTTRDDRPIRLLVNISDPAWSPVPQVANRPGAAQSLRRLRKIWSAARLIADEDTRGHDRRTLQLMVAAA